MPMFSFATGTLANPYSKFSHKELALTINQIQLSGPVGGKYNYSNLGVGLLGEAPVRTTGLKNYELLLADRVIKVLHMRDMHIPINDDMHPRPAPGHNEKGDEIVGWDFVCLQGAGAMKSTFDDMLRFTSANLQPEQSPLEAARLKHCNRLPTNRVIE